MPVTKLTIEVAVDAADYAAFKAECDAAGRTVVPSFGARLNEVFGPDGGVLTTAYVHDVRAGQELDMDALRDRIRWHREIIRFRQDWLRETDQGGWDLTQARAMGQLDGLMIAWKELNRLVYGEVNVSE